jgi:single-stranded-DNA-specific exonuclease
LTRWVDPQPIDIPQEIREVVADAAPYDALLAGMLVRRGIADVRAAQGFIDPAAYAPHSPEVLPDLERAVVRLEQAVARGERIVVWGDFDVDGQTATALYLQALRELGGNVTFAIPTRRQSHGVHPVGVQRLIDQGMRLLLTADTGVDAGEAIGLAVSHGVDVLITDHHDLPEHLPNAQALVNPKRLPTDHPLYELPGVGVAYQVMRALFERVGLLGSERYLDLVALGIVADVATLRGDVRYLLQLGLDVLRSGERLGLKSMMALARLNPANLTEEDIGFALAPRLNALSRVGDELDATSGVELLTTDDLTRARTIATALEALNARRRWLTRQTTDAALSQLERDRSLLDGPAVVVSGAAWDPGIVGIVAGRLAERFNKPAIVFSAPEGEMARGSARSVEGIDIHAAIAAQRHMLHRCGGHPMAAGLSLEGSRIPEFRRALRRTLAQTGAVPEERTIGIDAYLSLDQLTPELVRAVSRLAPFGAGNDRPIFATKDLELVSSAIVGRTREHRRALVRDPEGREQTVMWWRGADETQPEGRFDLAYTLGINTFRNEVSVQIGWVDARLREPAAALLDQGVRAKTEIEVRDHRALSQSASESVLRTLRSSVPDAVRAVESVVVWAEGGTPSIDGVPFSDREALHDADTLVVWTIPPGPVALRGALKTVSPKRVVLFCIDPGLDAPQAFLQRLGGLVKHVLRTGEGQTSLSTLAAKMAHDASTVRLGLEWMAQKGQIEIVSSGSRRLALRGGSGVVGTRLDIIQARLQAQLAETAAYRTYYRHADGKRLVEE